MALKKKNKKCLLCNFKKKTKQKEISELEEAFILMNLQRKGKLLPHEPKRYLLMLDREWVFKVMGRFMIVKHGEYSPNWPAGFTAVVTMDQLKRRLKIYQPKKEKL